jgi:hypothetical protein
MIVLPESMRVFERGWLSSNNVLLVDDACAALVDTGYASHAPQTVALVRQALGTRITAAAMRNCRRRGRAAPSFRLPKPMSCVTGTKAV